MKTLPLLASALLLAASGCATSNHKASAPYLAVLQQRGVDPGTYTRISEGRVLTYGDILNLVQRGIPGDRIVDYLKATRAPYRFSASQLNSLSRAGASPALIAFLRQAPSQPMAEGFNNPTTQAYLNSPYWRNPYYMGGSPFEFTYPDSWFSPGGQTDPVLE